MKFEHLTMKDEGYCPDCGDYNTYSDEDWGENEFRVCISCKSRYVINYYTRVAKEVYILRRD